MLFMLQAWRQGRTGYPLVDAAMRELWSTGWMHNRMRCDNFGVGVFSVFFWAFFSVFFFCCHG